jgi:hypothetical protein
MESCWLMKTRRGRESSRNQDTREGEVEEGGIRMEEGMEDEGTVNVHNRNRSRSRAHARSTLPNPVVPWWGFPRPTWKN